MDREKLTGVYLTKVCRGKYNSIRGQTMFNNFIKIVYDGFMYLGIFLPFKFLLNTKNVSTNYLQHELF